MPTEFDGLRREIERLRDWRHDEAVPRFAAAQKELDSLRGRTAALERRLATLEKSVAQMAEAGKIAAAVTSALQQQRGGILTKRQRWIGFAVAVAALISSMSQVAQWFAS